MNRYITLDENKKVISIRYGSSIVEGEIKSDVGELGQIQQSDGSFTNHIPEIITPQPTLEDKINYIYYKSMGVI